MFKTAIPNLRRSPMRGGRRTEYWDNQQKASLVLGVPTSSVRDNKIVLSAFRVPGDRQMDMHCLSRVSSIHLRQFRLGNHRESRIILDVGIFAESLRPASVAAVLHWFAISSIWRLVSIKREMRRPLEHGLQQKESSAAPWSDQQKQWRAGRTNCRSRSQDESRPGHLARERLGQASSAEVSLPRQKQR